MPKTPWIGLAALVAMFAIPFLPAWLFEGPRHVRHWPRRHVCAECGAPWVDGHDCATAALPAVGAPAARVDELPAPEPPLRGELRRLRPRRAELERVPEERLAG
jgi:hypothetical protein